MQGREAAWQAGGRMVQTPTSPVLPQVVLNFNGTSQELMAVSEHKLYWPLGYPPPDIPKCGFDNEDPACNQGDQPMLSEALHGATASSPGELNRGFFAPDFTSLPLSCQLTDYLIIPPSRCLTLVSLLQLGLSHRPLFHTGGSGFGGQPLSD